MNHEMCSLHKAVSDLTICSLCLYSVSSCKFYSGTRSFNSSPRLYILLRNWNGAHLHFQASTVRDWQLYAFGLSIPFSCMKYVRNSFREFFLVWHKCPLGLKYELISVWWPDFLSLRSCSQWHFSGQYSTPSLRNRGAECDHFSNLVRYCIRDINLWSPPFN